MQTSGLSFTTTVRMTPTPSTYASHRYSNDSLAWTGSVRQGLISQRQRAHTLCSAIPVLNPTTALSFLPAASTKGLREVPL